MIKIIIIEMWLVILKVKMTAKMKKIFVDIDKKVEAPSKTTVNARVVQAMKQLQALYKEDVNKINKQAA